MSVKNPLALPSFDQEIEALAVLKKDLADEWADDPDFLVSLADSETSLIEIMNALTLADLSDEGTLIGVDAAIDTLDFRRTRIKQRKERRRALIERALIMLERDKIELPSGTISMARRPRKLHIDDESQIPAAFWKEKTELKLDKKAVEEALRDNRDVPGAHLDNGSVSLTVRRK